MGFINPPFRKNNGTVTDATNAMPIVVTTGAVHKLTDGQRVVIASVTGNTAANGSWIINVLTTTTFELNGSTGNGAYAGGGTWKTGKPNRYIWGSLSAPRRWPWRKKQPKTRFIKAIFSSAPIQLSTSDTLGLSSDMRDSSGYLMRGLYRR